MIDLSDRSECFYWQTDRKLSAQDYEKYFLRRQEITTEQIENILRNSITVLSEIQTIEVEIPDENVLKGNVNIVRKVKINGKSYVVRLHPFGIKNGYFYCEALALQSAKKIGLPVPEVLEIHEANGPKDLDFVLMTLSKGQTMEFAIRDNPQSEADLLHQAGQALAKIHSIQTKGFGFFDNKQAKRGEFIGIHPNYQRFISSGLEENIQRLISFQIINEVQGQSFRQVFQDLQFEPHDGPRLIHNDFADWNILVDGGEISGILDWDECHSGDPIADLACWSTFYDLERFGQFLKGYESILGLPADFELRFHYYRLRYTISKMALRVKRAQVDHADFVREKIEVGKKALKEEIAWFSANR